MKQKQNPALLIALIIAAVVIITLAVLLFLSKNQISGAEPEASASNPTTSQSQSETDQPPSWAVTADVNSEAQAGQEKLVDSMIRTDIPVLTEEEKLEQIDFTNRMFRPVYNPAITLTAEGGLDGGAQTVAPWTGIVTPDGDQNKAFGISLSQDQAAATSKIIWQVSCVPFSGGPTASSVKPGGLLLSGELPNGATSFTVDFSKVYSAEYKLYHPSTGGTKSGINTNILKPNIQLPNQTLDLLSSNAMLEPVPLRTYYVRAFPVDSAGNSLGDSGAGLPVLYGDPQPAPKNTGSILSVPTLSMKFSLMTTLNAGSVYYNGEFPNNFRDISEVTMYNTSSKLHSVLPGEFPDATQKLLIQVSLSDFTGTAATDWTNVPGLVYETSVSSDDPVFKALGDNYPAGIAIDFSNFVPADSALPEKDYIPYYIRAVAMTAGTKPGTAGASYSETIIINYGKYQIDENFKFYPQIKIDPTIPVVESLTYTPVQWEADNWQYHYVITRQPTEKEVFMGWGSDAPFGPFQVGTKLDFTPQPENKSWWEEAWDAISDFFGSIVDFVGKIVNWVSKAYADLKSGLINIVVSALPSDLQGPLRTALTAMVDYGLASMGIPPTLPNFDELANMGTDYLAAVAMEQAGIPANAIVEYGVDELSDKIGSSLTSSAQTSSPNPMNWDFVKLDPDDLYRPAYLTLELYNPYDEPTPSGKLSFTVDKFMDMKKNGTDSAITYLYAAYGSSYVCLYKPVYGMEIPSLAPGQHLTVPVILEEYVGIPFPGCPAPVDSNSFRLMYHGLGQFNFGLFIAYDLPSVAEEAKKQGYTEDAIYSYSTFGNSASFSVDPGESYSK